MFTDPFAFICEADDTDHAEEQCRDAEPDADILWVVETNDVDVAKSDYYGLSAEQLREVDERF
jgi:hypothetical protein